MKSIAIVGLLAGLAGAQPAPPTPPSKTLERAIKLYDKTDYYSSMIELTKVTQGESGDDESNKQRARFFLGKAEFQLGYYVAALGMFTEISNTMESPYRAAAFKWSAAIVDKLDTPGTRYALARFIASDLEDPSFDPATKESLRYHAGVVAIETAANPRAHELMDTLPASSKWYAKSRYALGMIEADDAKRRSHFLAAAKDPTLATDIAIGYAAHSGGGALELPDPRSKFELSRAAIATTAPSFKADIQAIAALAIGESCTAGPSDNAHDRLIARAGELKKLFAKILADEDNAETYDAITQLRKQPIDATTAPLAVLFGDREMREQLVFIAEIMTELDAIQHADKAWQTTMNAAEILQELTVQSSIAMADAGKMYMQRMQLFLKALERLTLPTTISIGPSVKTGIGLVVSAELCATIGTTTAPQMVTPSGTTPGGSAPVARAHGCGGCNGGGDAGMFVAFVGLLGLRRRRH